MAGIADETAGVGEHTVEKPESGGVREDAELLPDAVAMIQEPPRRAQLHFSRRLSGKVADHRRERIVGIGIERIYDGLGKTIVLFDVVEELPARLDVERVAYAVDTAVRADGGKARGILIA